MDDKTYISTKEACEILGVCHRTLYNWEKAGKLPFITTGGGHHRYDKEDILKRTRQTEIPKRKYICYARVSTASQSEDLERQIDFFRREYPTYTIVRDIGSGINFKRKGFKTILDDAIKGNIAEIVVTHKDRFTRFGFELFQDFVSRYSWGKIVVLNNTETSAERELVDDIIAIITVFSSRIYGLRSHKLKRKIQEIISQSKDDREPEDNETTIVPDEGAD